MNSDDTETNDHSTEFLQLLATHDRALSLYVYGSSPTRRMPTTSSSRRK